MNTRIKVCKKCRGIGFIRGVKNDEEKSCGACYGTGIYEFENIY